MSSSTDLVKTCIKNASQQFDECLTMAKENPILAGIAEVLDVQKIVFDHAVLEYLLDSRLMMEKSAELSNAVESLGPTCTDIGQFMNAVRALVTFAQEYETYAKNLAQVFRDIYVALTNCSKDANDCLEKEVQEKMEEMDKLLKDIDNANGTKTFGKVFAGLGATGVAGAITVGILAPQVALGAAAVASLSGLVGVGGAATIKSKGNSITALTGDIQGLMVKIDNNELMKALCTNLEDSAKEIRQIEIHWQARGVEAERLFERLQGYENKGRHLGLLEAKAFRRKWTNYQTDFERYSTEIWQYLSEQVQDRYETVMS
ncbi:6439_t:CDS:1 [Paraglomus brasilianum]|uniref:6439_t:CDS:1 n=1 Tax=Paraglomus brasilianum TaxID=144538 RepID=A0A9N8WSR4_9GLOM|nr:6439_t:CDS:1 [Paraglomus brasilianum]